MHFPEDQCFPNKSLLRMCFLDDLRLFLAYSIGADGYGSVDWAIYSHCTPDAPEPSHL